ncbi:MAG: (Fe-S)-binding protein, partial [Firmicutes bacterium]|nr:(Fe-S)-binding protein [Bacillota bacterium]
RLFPARTGQLPVGTVLEPAHSRGAVAYFTGCAVAGFFPEIARATRRVLLRNGWKVLIPSNGCCGMPQQAYGCVEFARRLARRNIDLFIDHEAIVTDCATCGSALKSYAALLAGDSAYGQKAAAFSAKVRDISEFLTETGFLPPEKAYFRKQTAVAYHDPCHLFRSQGIRQQPRSILKAVPGVVLEETDGPETCCGGSGLFALTHPYLSGKVGKEKIKSILSTGASVVTSGCPGCIMQLKAAFQMENHGIIRVAHPVELLEASYGAGSEMPEKI